MSPGKSSGTEKKFCCSSGQQNFLLSLFRISRRKPTCTRETELLVVIDNLAEISLQRGTADQSAVDVGL